MLSAVDARLDEPEAAVAQPAAELTERRENPAKDQDTKAGKERDGDWYPHNRIQKKSHRRNQAILFPNYGQRKNPDDRSGEEYSPRFTSSELEQPDMPRTSPRNQSVERVIASFRHQQRMKENHCGHGQKRKLRSGQEEAERIVYEHGNAGEG